MGLHEKAPALRFPEWQERRKEETYKPKPHLALYGIKSLVTSAIQQLDVPPSEYDGPLVRYFRAHDRIVQALGVAERNRNTASRAGDLVAENAFRAVAWDLAGVRVAIEQTTPVARVRARLQEAIRLVERLQKESGETHV